MTIYNIMLNTYCEVNVCRPGLLRIDQCHLIINLNYMSVIIICKNEYKVVYFQTVIESYTFKFSYAEDGGIDIYR